jgi:hypothetical protein
VERHEESFKFLVFPDRLVLQVIVLVVSAVLDHIRKLSVEAEVEKSHQSSVFITVWFWMRSCDRAATT